MEALLDRDSGVVVEDVERSELLDAAPDRRDPVVLFPNVALMEDRGASCCRCFLDGRRARVAVDLERHDLRPFARRGQQDGAAEPRARAGDDSCLSRESHRR